MTTAKLLLSGICLLAVSCTSSHVELNKPSAPPNVVKKQIDVPLPNFERSNTKLLKTEQTYCSTSIPRVVKHAFMIPGPLERHFYSFGTPDKITVIVEHQNGYPINAWVDKDGNDERAEEYWEGMIIPGYPDPCTILEGIYNPRKRQELAMEKTKNELAEREERRNSKGSSSAVGSGLAYVSQQIKQVFKEHPGVNSTN